MLPTSGCGRIAASATLRAESDGAGHWRVNGVAVEELDGCLDIDLEASACTNTLPIHRLGLGVGQTADAPAVYVRAVDLAVERLEQRYARVDSDGSTPIPLSTTWRRGSTTTTR